MHISDSAITFAGRHLETTQRKSSETLRVWGGSASSSAVVATSRSDSLQLSATARALAATAPPRPPVARSTEQATQAPAMGAGACGTPEIDDLLDGIPPKYRVLALLLEKMTGYKIRLCRGPDDPADRRDGKPAVPASHAYAPAAPPRQGWGLQYDAVTSVIETEETVFRAEGVINTADGQQVRFRVELAMRREATRTEEFHLRAGDALTDPLVLNFNGRAAELSDMAFAFDLNADGRDESIPFVTRGSGVLALDRDGDGRVNDGDDLFGPRTGDGFAELAVHDQDGNGWIDEHDAVFQHLRVWTKDDRQQDLLTPLAEAGVGAIYLDSAATPFALLDGEEQQGQIRATGVFLTETGTVGTVQQVDLATRQLDDAEATTGQALPA